MPLEDWFSDRERSLGLDVFDDVGNVVSWCVMDFGVRERGISHAEMRCYESKVYVGVVLLIRLFSQKSNARFKRRE